MKDKLIELIINTPPTRMKAVGRMMGKTYTTASGIADHLLANGVVVLPCRIGDTVYVIEPLFNGIWGNDEHKCWKCEHFYKGGMGDSPDCSLDKNCCYSINETKADLRHIADWITPSAFTKEIAWGKTVFLTRKEAENALAERSRQ